MPVLTPLSDTVSVTGQVARTDLDALARQGFKTLLNVRPDGEEVSQISSQELAAACAEHGFTYAHVPATAFDVFSDNVVSAAGRALDAAAEGADAGRVVMSCASGQRAAIVWAAASARRRSVNDVLEVLSKAGLALEFLRDDLEQQADRYRWQSMDKIIAAPAVKAA